MQSRVCIEESFFDFDFTRTMALQMLGGSLAFTTPSVHFAASTVTMCASNGSPEARDKLIGLIASEWPSYDDSTTTLGAFVHTSMCSTDAKGRVVAVTKAPAVGLMHSQWPNVYDSKATLGGFVHTSFCTTDMIGMVVPTAPAPCVPVDSVPAVVGLTQSQWPAIDDSSKTLGSFVFTSM
jgi:hypothetical protein